MLFVLTRKINCFGQHWCLSADQRGQPATNTLPIQRCTLSSTGGQPKKSRRLWRVGKAVKVVSQLFVWRDNDLDIGYPTDVKHVAHIGWDGPSIDGPGWVCGLSLYTHNLFYFLISS
jgi:hypothetical protein